MERTGRRWTVHDREGHPVYLTEERWAHITDAGNHPEVAAFEWLLLEALRRGRRRQEPLNPRKYRYTLLDETLPDGYNHLVAIVVFGFDVDEHGSSRPNNYVATAFLKHIRPKN